VVIGLLAWIPTVVRQRREIGRLKRAAEKQAALASRRVARRGRRARSFPRTVNGI
jgi:hypothetical protein